METRDNPATGEDLRTRELDHYFESRDIPRNRDKFLRELLRELSGTLEEVVGLEKASGFISVVGSRIGRAMNDEYRGLENSDRLDRDRVAAALVDLKRRIDGGFSLEALSEDRIVLSNTRCPFGEFVEGRDSLCMMTSNVFGKIAAENLGYARVELQETIAKGDAGCKVIIHLTPGHGSGRLAGLEYFEELPPDHE